MTHIMHYILYGIVTVGILGGAYAFYHFALSSAKEIWKDGGAGNRFTAMSICFFLLVLLYYIYRFLEFGYNAFFN